MSAGEAFNWTNATFNWDSATAAKLWAASTRTQHDVGVSISWALTEQRRATVSKPIGEAFQCSSAYRKLAQIRLAQGLSIAQSYADLIAFVLRFVEAFALAEQRHHQGGKALADAWQTGERSSKAGTTSFADALGISGAKRRDGKLVQSETLSVTQSYADIIAFVLRFVEFMGVDDEHALGMVKKLWRDIGFDEHQARHSSKSLSSGFAMGEGARWEFLAAVLEAFGLAYGFGRGLDLPLKEQFGVGSVPHRELVSTCLESFGVEGALAREVSRRVQENLDVSPSFARAQIKPLHEMLKLFNVGLREVSKRNTETIGLEELVRKNAWRVVVQALGVSVSSGLDGLKALAEVFATTEQSRFELIKRVAESLSLLETYTDLIAFIVSVSEALRLDERAANAVVKPIAEIWSASDDIRRDLTKDIHVVLAVLGALNKDLRQALVELLSMDGALAKSTAKALADALSTTDDLHRDSIASWSTAIGITELLNREGRKALHDAIVMATSLGKSSGKLVTEQLMATDVTASDVAKYLSEAVSVVDAYADLIAWLLSIKEVVAISDGVGYEFSKQIQESVTALGQCSRTNTKSLSEAFALAELTGRTVAYRRSLNEGLQIGEAISRAQALSIREALDLAEQYRRHANGVISDMIISSLEMTEQDFMDVVEAGHAPGYTDFRDFIAGDYTYARAMFRAVLHSKNADRGYIKGLRLSVDVPDVLDRGTATITSAANGVTVSFARSFRAPPEVTLTHKGGTVLAIARLVGNATTTGFTAVLEDSTGQRVTGAFSWIAQGY